MSGSIVRSCILSLLVSVVSFSGSEIHENEYSGTRITSNCNIIVDAGPDLTICPNESKQLQGSINGNYSNFRWEPSSGLSNPNSLNPTVSTNIDRTYTLIAEGTSNNLITNGGFEDGSIAPSTTGYAFTDPNNFIFAGDGSYTIGNSATLGNIWGCSPHSGNWAMAINGATGGGVDVWCQTVNVTPGADHRFEAWIMGITIPFMVSYANLEFSINGDVLGTLEAPPNTCSWAPFMAMWNSGASSSATICIRNLNTSSTGNYCAIDDIALFEKCEVRDEVEVTVDEVTARVNGSPLVTCDMNPVLLDATGSSSGPGYTYFWDTSDGEIVGPRTDIRVQVSKPGTYTFTVTSPAGCMESVDVFVDGNVSPPDLNVVGDTLSCDKPTGRLSAFSFTPDVTFKWKGPDGFTSSEPEPAISDTGNYTVIVSDIYGCKDSITLNVPSSGFLPTLDIAGDTIRCDQDSAILIASSNAGMPTYQWLGPGNFTSDTIQITAVDTGWYKVLLTDTTGCQTSDSFYVASLVEELHPQLSGDTISCDQPQVRISVKNDTIGSRFAWTGPNGFSSSLSEPLTSEPGWYYLNISDDNTCYGYDSILITSDLDKPVAVFMNDTLNCLDTSARITQLSAEGAYQYLWTGPNGFTSMETEPELTDTGIYQVILTGQNGCMDTLQQRLYGSLELPDLIVENDTINCVDPVGELIGISGTNGVTFSWMGPNGFSSSNATIQVQETGSYILEITAPNGCTSRQTAILSADLAVPGVLGIPDLDTLDCITTSLELNIETDNKNYQYEWSGPSGFSSNDENPVINDPGDYTLRLTGTNGCDTTVQLTVIENTAAPDISASGNTITCNEPSVRINGNSVTPGVTFEWSGPGGFSSNESSPQVDEPGTYVLTVTAPNGCTSSTQVIVEEDADFPEVQSIDPDTLTCVKQSIDLTAEATGTGLSYQWSEMGNSLGTNQDITISQPGSYTLAVTNNSGCTKTIDFEIAIDTAAPGLVLLADTITCFQPEVLIWNSDHMKGWNYLWTGPGNYSSRNSEIVVTVGGFYEVVVTDPKNGCTKTVGITVEERTDALMGIETDITEPTCGQSNGVISILSVQGGSGPYEYSLDGGNSFQQDPEFSNIGAGAYELLARDVFGCEFIVEIDITMSQSVTISVPPVITLPAGGTGVIDLQINKPLSEIASIVWDPAKGLSCSDCTNPIITATVPEIYTVTVTDIDGCMATATVRIEVLTGSNVFIPNAFTPNDDGNNDIFRPSVSSPPDKMDIQIFDRWGNRVFIAEQAWDNNAGWEGTSNNGKELLPGVYIYRITLYYAGEQTILTGDVTLLR